jgi:WS/DGAT/MGAT family acyltransferase
MQQLSGTDTAFLTMETRTTYGHVGSLYEFGPEATYDAVRGQIENRLHLLPPFRRRLVEVPLGLDNPYWIESLDFDLDFHIREIAVPAPGNREQLAELVARLASRPMDRSRPLWEWYVISGLETGNVAHYAKTHHATIDGASGNEMMTVLLDETPEPRPVPPPEGEWKPEEKPSDLNLLGRTMLNYARRPRHLARAQVRLMRELASRSTDPTMRRILEQSIRQMTQPVPNPLGDLFRRRGNDARDGDEAPPTPNTTAPRTMFNASITPHRRLAYCSVPLSDAKKVKNHFGVTLNDVVLAMCAGALRMYLEDHHSLPTDPLIAMCPVSIRTGAETDTYSNRVSGMAAPLATHIDDPVERLMSIHRGTKVAKEQFNAIPADALQDFGRFSPPAVAARASRVMARMRIADRMNPPFNLVISNVPGPRHPLYLAGAMLQHLYPVSTIGDGMGLNMTVVSYRDQLDFGSVACRELMPDLWVLNDHLPHALDELLAAAN